MRSLPTSNIFDMSTSRTLHWFRNDLRLDDNPALAEALRSDEVLPVVVLDDRFWSTDRWGHVKTGPFRTRFLLESIADLKAALEGAGGALLIKEGRPEDILPALMKEWSCSKLTAQAEHTPEELDIEAAVANAVFEVGGTCRWVEGHTLFHPDDLPMDLEAIPDIFTQFRKKVEKHSEVRECIAAPSALSCPGGWHQTKFHRCRPCWSARAKPCHLPTAAGFCRSKVVPPRPGRA